MTAFVNEPHLELRRASVRDAALAALRHLDRRLPVAVTPIVSGERLGGNTFESVDPGRPDRVVATACSGGPEQIDAAVRAAAGAATVWGALPATERAATLSRAAGLMRAGRLEITALAVRECAKPWPEADADVCEAIDFLEYYARAAVELDRGRNLIQLPGERNRLRYAPRGVVGVIAPWNFPLAIPTGMTAAALAVGNAVVLKPAAQAPACAARIADCVLEAGVPAAALHLIPGGDDIGAALVRHPGVHVINFTGSGAAGLEIIRVAATIAPGQHHVKRVVSEMGGKNIIIVDADADLDDAVPAIATSAFGFAGQKCSAASRVVAHEAIAARLEQRLAGMIATLRIGQADDFATDVPPLIDAESQERVRRFIELGKRDGRLVATTTGLPDDGYFVPAGLIADPQPRSPLIEREIFGPLLTLERVAGIEQACDLVDCSPFGLTGGVFSRSPHVIEYVCRRSPVGNLYINREITGAMVGRQPFGGNRLSGSGTKAGGPDYLLSFCDPQAITENTVRHGLVI